jgi:hypothetical protein
MKHIKVSLYVREHGHAAIQTSQAQHILFSRYHLRPTLRFDLGNTHRSQPETISVKMLDAAIDAYLHEVEATRKPKTHSVYKTSLGYFFESTGNKPLSTNRKVSPPTPPGWRMLAAAKFLWFLTNWTRICCLIDVAGGSVLFSLS